MQFIISQYKLSLTSPLMAPVRTEILPIFLLKRALVSTVVKFSFSRICAVIYIVLLSVRRQGKLVIFCRICARAKITPYTREDDCLVKGTCQRQIARLYVIL